MLSRTLFKQFKTLRNDEHSSEAEHSIKVGIQQAELRKLIHLLTDCVLHHDFDQAGEIMDALCLRANEAGEVSIKVSKEVMLQDNDEDAYSDILKFYKHLFLLSQKFRLENIMEMTFFLLSHGHFDEAFQNFERSVNNDPYNCNPLCQGYTGALAYYLWSKEEGGPIEKMDANLPPIDDDTCSIISGIEVYSQNDSSNCRLMMNHFNQLMKLLSESDGVFDYFIYTYWQGLIKLEKLQEAFEMLMQYKRRFPHSINSHRYILTHCKMYPVVDENETTVFDVKNSLAQLDPSNPEVLSLIEKNGIHSYQDMFTIIVRFLDYPHNGKNATAWHYFQRIRKNWPDYEKSPQWLCRKKWWMKLYKDKLSVV